MLENRGKRRRFSTAHYQTIWNFYLSKASAIIASTLTPVTLHAAITEAVQEFAQSHGHDEVPIFLALLAERLDGRGKPVASAAIRYLQANGVLPSIPESEVQKFRKVTQTGIKAAGKIQHTADAKWVPNP